MTTEEKKIAHRAAVKRWVSRNREKNAKAKRKYALLNADKIKERTAKYYQEKKEYLAEYYQKNKGHIKEVTARYREANRESIRKKQYEKRGLKVQNSRERNVRI